MCLPNAIPDEVEADVSGMELGDSLHVHELSVADGIDMATEGELTVATVLIPRGLRDSANAGEEGGEEAAEAGGEDAPAADGDGGSDD